MTRTTGAIVGAALTVLLGSFAVVPAMAEEPVVPTVSFVGITEGATYLYGQVPAPVTCNTTAVDELGAVLPCTVEGLLTTVGTHMLTAVVADADVATLTYTVKTTLKGFYGPVKERDAWNTRKAGSTVPLKFKIVDANGVKATSTAAVVSFVATPVPCSVGAPVVGVVIDLLTVTGHGQTLKFQKGDSAFHKNWKTPKAAKAVKVKGKKPAVTPSCYAVTMTASDGQSLTALFKLK